MENIIRKHCNQFNLGIARIKDKRCQWSHFVAFANPLIEGVVLEARHQNLFEHLYVLDSTRNQELSNKLPILQLSFGQHPVGFSEFSSNTLVIESGCALTFSQLVSGQVVCTLYPFHSQLHSRNEKYIIAHIFSAPDKIKERHVRNLVKSLFSYAQVSSVYGAPVLSDWLCVYWLKSEHWWLHFKLGSVAMNLLDKITGIALENAGT